MPTATHRLNGLIAVSADSDSKSLALGYITWFSVPDQDVPLRQLRKQWQLAGLDPKPLPKDPKAVNVFKRAVAAQAGRRVNEADGTVTETDVRLVVENTDDVVYAITRVARDLEERDVIYQRALKAWFSKVTGQIDFKSGGGIPRRDVLPIVAEIQDAFDEGGKTIPGPRVRTLVRDYIKHTTDEQDELVGLSGEAMGGSEGRPGQPYFVLAAHEAGLDALSAMLHELYRPHGRAYLTKVPLADGATERELIRRHHATNSIGEIEEAMAEVRDLIKRANDPDRERRPRENVVKFHWRRLERLRRRAAEYNRVLGEEQEDVQSHLDLLQRQARKLMDV